MGPHASTARYIVLLMSILVYFVVSQSVSSGQNHLSTQTHAGAGLHSRRGQSVHALDDMPLGAIFMLVSDWRTLRLGRKCYFNLSMNALASKWRPHNPHPIILMDTKPWERRDMVDIRRTWSTLDFKFINIGRVWNGSPKIPEISFEDAAKPISTLNYKRMCHFFFKGFTEVPLLMEYKYLLRVDDDTCIHDHINFDIFQRINQKRAAYAYSHSWYDSPHVTNGLYDFAAKFVASNHITWKNEELHNQTISAKNFPNDMPSFNTNFEVINTIRYREPSVMQFINAVVASNMIYHRRWGDAPLRFVTAMLFWTEREMVRLEGFELQHSAWRTFTMTEHPDSNNPSVEYQ